MGNGSTCLYASLGLHFQTLMSRLLPPRQFFIVFFSLTLAAFVIFLSLWRLNLSMLGPDERDSTASVSAGERLRQLFTPPILPDHPLYVLGMVSDRLDLWLASPEERFMLKLEYADVRLATSQALVERGRPGMAITTLTKAEKYIISAAEEIQNLDESKKESARVKLLNTIKVHRGVLSSMKPSFSGPQQATIDRFIEQILILVPNR